jgi:ABC-type sugar transport system permease subunit
VTTTSGQAVAAGRVSAPRPSAAQRLARAASKLTLPVILLLPAMTIIVGLIGYPLGRTIWMSFTDTRLGDLINGTSTWVGLDNFKQVFTDPQLRSSLVNTVVFGSACVVGTMALGMAVALLLNQRLRFNWFFSLAVLLPWAVPALAASSIFKWLFDDRYGFVNWALVNLGFHHFQDYAWFADRNSAYVAMFVVVVWQSFPFIALSLLAGLQTYVLAQGVPDRAADTAAVTGYRESFALGHFGTGAAIAVVLFCVLLVLSIACVRLVGKEART